MADSPELIAAAYPLPSYRFVVTVGSERMAFSSVSGLDQSVELIQYKDGAGGHYQMPGQRAPITISLKRGIIAKQSQLYDWLNSINFNQVDKKDISISLTNEAGTDLLVTWNVGNAFPTKLSAPNLDATSNDVAFEEISVAADRISVKFH